MTQSPRGPECSGCPCGLAALASGSSCPFGAVARDKGDVLFREGDLAERVWFVRRGTVMLERFTSASGGARVHAVRRTGSFVGLEALVRRGYLDTARTAEPTLVCGASKAVVDHWLGDRHTPARVALEQVLLTEAVEQPRSGGPDGPAPRRVARWILKESLEGEGLLLPRRHVASLLNMVPETFSRALAQLVERGAIEASRTRLHIKDIQALRAAADPL